jgi:sec-independent protein translocase protein TatA
MIGKLALPAFNILSPGDLLVIVVIALLVFGPSKLSGLGKGLGEGIRNFKSAIGGEGSKAEEEKK